MGKDKLVHSLTETYENNQNTVLCAVCIFKSTMGLKLWSPATALISGT